MIFPFLRPSLITDPFDARLFRGSVLLYGSLYKTHETNLRLKRFFGLVSRNGFLPLFNLWHLFRRFPCVYVSMIGNSSYPLSVLSHI